MLIAFAVLFGVAALVMPLEVVEVMGLPLIVAAAYSRGVRGGLVMAVWGAFVVSIATSIVSGPQAGDFAATVVGYLIVGAGLGFGVDRFATECRRLQTAVEAAEAAKRYLAASQKRYRLLFETSNDAVYLHGLDAHGEPTPFVAVNDAMCARVGYAREELLGLTLRAVDGDPRPGRIREAMQRLLIEDRIVYETVRKTRDGHLEPVEVSSSLTDVDGERLVISISRDISERKRTERRLAELSLKDDLTGLLNRRGFHVMLPEQAKLARRSGGRISVLCADVDDFKVVNDTMGHRRGDDVLKMVADLLRATFRETDLVARLGGDEFCVVAQEDQGADPHVLGERLDQALAMANEQLGLSLTMSHGTVSTDWRGLDLPDELLTRADMLMYEAKRRRERQDGMGLV